MFKGNHKLFINIFRLHSSILMYCSLLRKAKKYVETFSAKINFLQFS